MKNFTNLYWLFSSLLIALLFISCEEEEGPPLTLDDIYKATNSDREPFKALINGFEFKASVVAAGKEGNQFYFIGANDEGASINVRTLDIMPGIYSGLDTNANNIIYKNAQGRSFSSVSPNKKPDAKISIRSYSSTNRLASGSFSGTLYSTDSGERLSLTSGEFNSASVFFPFVGIMTAEVGANVFNANKCQYTTSQNSGIDIHYIDGFANNDLVSINLKIEGPIQVKSYDIAESSVTAKYNANRSSTNHAKYQYSGVSGSLNIVQIDLADKKIYGNFGFEAINANGENLSVKYGDFQALIK